MSLSPPDFLGSVSIRVVVINRDSGELPTTNSAALPGVARGAKSRKAAAKLRVRVRGIQRRSGGGSMESPSICWDSWLNCTRWRQ